MEGEEEEETPDAKEAKEIQAWLRKAKSVKQKMSEAISSASDLSVAINTDPEWGWASSEQVSGPLRQARTVLDSSKSKNSFWKSWLLDANFSSTCGKSHTVLAIKVEFKHLDTIESAIRSEAEAAITPGPYAFCKIIAMPPEDGHLFDILI